MLYARGGPSTYDSKMGMVITDETGRHVDYKHLQVLNYGIFQVDISPIRGKTTYSKKCIPEQKSGNYFYNDLNYLSAYCRDWRCWRFTYTPYGELLDIYYLEKPYDTLVRANNEIIFRSGLHLLHSKLGVVVSSVSDESKEKSKSTNREIDIRLRKFHCGIRKIRKYNS